MALIIGTTNRPARICLTRFFAAEDSWPLTGKNSWNSADLTGFFGRHIPKMLICAFARGAKVGAVFLNPEALCCIARMDRGAAAATGRLACACEHVYFSSGQAFPALRRGWNT